MRAISFRLTHKIVALGLVGLSGVVLVGGLHMFGEARMSAHRDAAENARETAHLNDRMQVELLEARRAEKDFLLRNDIKKADRQVEIGRAFSSDADTLYKRIAGLQPELARQINSMRDSLNRYEEHFLAAVDQKKQLGLNEKSGLEGRLRASVHDIEARVESLNDPKLLVHMLMMRRHEKDFMLRRDPKYGDDMKKRAAQFSAAVDSSDIPQAAKAEFKQKLADYQRDFFAWMGTALKLSDELKETTQSAAAVEPIIETVSQAIEQARADAERSSKTIMETVQFQMELGIAAITVAVFAVAFLIGRSVSQPLSRLRAAMIELANGNFAVVLPGLGRKDEVGEIAQAVETFKENAKKKAQQEAEAKTEQDGKLAELRKADMHKLADSFESAVGEIVKTVSSAAGELEASAHSLTETATRGNELATSVSAASEEASANVQSVASASEELSVSVSEISRQVQDSSKVADAAVGQAQRTNDRVSELSKAAGRIGDVIELINAIAGQTNLLALNATIEAARAGEAGRGFAVVAAEVKALAEQTAKATGEIDRHITDIQSATQDSVNAIQEIGNTIRKMSEISSAIAAAVDEQGAATRVISRNIQQAAEGTSLMSSNIADVQREASETGSASSQVLAAARSLAVDGERLRTEVGNFLNSVRAA